MSSGCQRTFSVRRVCDPTLYWLRMRPVVSSSGKRRVPFSSVGTYGVGVNLPRPRTKVPSCMIGVPSRAGLVARPLQAAGLVEAGEGDAGERGRERGDLVHDLRRVVVAHRHAHRLCQVAHRFPLVLAVARAHGRADTVDAPLGVGERAVLLQEAGAGQEHMREAGRLVEEQVLHHHELHRRQRGFHVHRVGVALGDVLALDEQALERAGDRRVEHVGDAQARLRRKLDAPERPRRCRARRVVETDMAVARSARAGTSPCRRNPARCSARAAGSRPRRRGRGCRWPSPGWPCPSPSCCPGCAR